MERRAKLAASMEKSAVSRRVLEKHIQQRVSLHEVLQDIAVSSQQVESFCKQQQHQQQEMGEAETTNTSTTAETAPNTTTTNTNTTTPVVVPVYTATGTGTGTAAASVGLVVATGGKAESEFSSVPALQLSPASTRAAVSSSAAAAAADPSCYEYSTQLAAVSPATVIVIAGGTRTMGATATKTKTTKPQAADTSPTTAPAAAVMRRD
jgi:hypothetical protein